MHRELPEADLKDFYNTYDISQRIQNCLWYLDINTIEKLKVFVLDPFKWKFVKNFGALSHKELCDAFFDYEPKAKYQALQELNKAESSQREAEEATNKSGRLTIQQIEGILSSTLYPHTELMLILKFLLTELKARDKQIQELLTLTAKLEELLEKK